MTRAGSQLGGWPFFYLTRAFLESITTSMIGKWQDQLMDMKYKTPIDCNGIQIVVGDVVKTVPPGYIHDIKVGKVTKIHGVNWIHVTFYEAMGKPIVSPYTEVIQGYLLEIQR